MKKTYHQPSVEVEWAEPEAMVCASDAITSNTGDITYGGVDEDGEKAPASRRQLNVWADE